MQNCAFQRKRVEGFQWPARSHFLSFPSVTWTQFSLHASLFVLVVSFLTLPFLEDGAHQVVGCFG